MSLLYVVVQLLSATAVFAQNAPTPGFESEIAPLLVKRCVECHRPGENAGNLNLTTRAGLLKGGDSGEVINLQDVSQSYLLERLQAGEMPPPQKGLSRKLPGAEIELLQRWLAAGANWPDDRILDLFEKTNDVRAGRDWWSLQPIVRPELPQPQTANASTNPIDLFVRQKLNQAGMEPAPRADRRILLRRLHDAVTGLPPTQEERESFLHDESADAWERKVDQLLESPHYGERWARHWLDLVRYADTSGYERDQEKSFAWKYRDWVADAFNSDMPYDRFIVLQLAGDEISERTAETVVATGMLRLGTWNDEPNDPEDYEYDRLEDLVHVTSSAFLGLTVKCARCHAHKFDPIHQEDYYRMASVFWAGPIQARDRALLGGPSAEELGFEEILGWTDLGTSPRPLHLLKNGEREHPQQEIEPASLSFIPELERTFDPPAEDATSTGRRLQLANWITDRRHPLPARVMVNRIWLHLFGEGIVRTPNNFGFLADPPTHPELLEWLAAEFIESGWSVKHIQRLILTSETWRQSSLHPKQAEYALTDSGNRLWWKANRRRRDAESLRDAMLAVSGEIDLRLGGPGFLPTVAPEALEGLSRKNAAWQASPSDEQRRRGLYMYSKRHLISPLMTTFDFNDTTLPCGQRDSTTVPTQSLALLNNQFVHDRSEAIARTIEATGEDADLVRAVWIRILGRAPSPQESRLAVDHLEQQRKRFGELEQHPPPKPKVRDDSLVLSLRADTGITRDVEGRVSGWKDASGHDHHASQSTSEQQAVWHADRFHGQPAVVFDGRNDSLNLNGALLNKEHCTIVAVVNDTGGSGHREIISNWNGSAGNSVTSMFLGLTGEKTIRFTDNFPDAGQLADREQPLILTAINGPQGASVYQNGTLIASRSTPLSPRKLDTDWVIGTQGNINGEYWQGGIAELRVYSRALNADERRQLETQLAERYQIELKSDQPEPQTPAFLALASLCHVLLNSNEFLHID